MTDDCISYIPGQILKLFSFRKQSFPQLKKGWSYTWKHLQIICVLKLQLKYELVYNNWRYMVDMWYCKSAGKIPAL